MTAFFTLHIVARESLESAVSASAVKYAVSCCINVSFSDERKWSGQKKTVNLPAVLLLYVFLKRNVMVHCFCHLKSCTVSRISHGLRF
eukprot:s70_g52.t1